MPIGKRGIETGEAEGRKVRERKPGNTSLLGPLDVNADTKIGKHARTSIKAERWVL